MIHYVCIMQRHRPILPQFFSSDPPRQSCGSHTKESLLRNDRKHNCGVHPCNYGKLKNNVWSEIAYSKFLEVGKYILISAKCLLMAGLIRNRAQCWPYLSRVSMRTDTWIVDNRIIRRYNKRWGELQPVLAFQKQLSAWKSLLYNVRTLLCIAVCD